MLSLFPEINWHNSFPSLLVIFPVFSHVDNISNCSFVYANGIKSETTVTMRDYKIDELFKYSNNTLNIFSFAS